MTKFQDEGDFQRFIVDYLTSKNAVVNARRAKYGDGLIKGLSLKLTAEFGPGYTVANLRNMRQFFLTFEPYHKTGQTYFMVSTWRSGRRFVI